VDDVKVVSKEESVVTKPVPSRPEEIKETKEEDQPTETDMTIEEELFLSSLKNLRNNLN
jgi:hypothetical protein